MKNARQSRFMTGAIALSFGLSLFSVCSSEIETIGNVDNEQLPAVGEIDVENAANSVGLWRVWHEQGVSEYFDSLSRTESKVFKSFNFDRVMDRHCQSPALAMDGYTIFFDEMEDIFVEGRLVDGVCGMALSLKEGQVAPLGMNLILEMPKGTLEFWFRPGKDFDAKSTRTLLGNDESRLHFFMQDGQLVFQKNHTDKHFFVMGDVQLDSGWNHIAGQWDGKNMALFVNEKLVASKPHEEGYQPSPRYRPFGNLLVVGFKTPCCMEGPGYSKYGDVLFTSGDYDQVRLSAIPRYEVEGDSAEEPVVFPEELPADTLVTEPESSSSDLEEIASSSSDVQADTLVKPEVQDSAATVLDSNDLFYTDFGGSPLYLSYGDSVATGFFMKEDIPQGTLEFSFTPGESFGEGNNALVGTHGGRMTVYYVNSGILEKGRIHIAMNQADIHHPVGVAYEFSKDSTYNVKLAWKDDRMYLAINDEVVAVGENEGYSPDARFGGIYDQLVIGTKNECCLINNHSQLYTDASFQFVRVTKRFLINLD